MGSFNAKPNRDKCTNSGTYGNIKYGVSCMQGWRSNMEDSHSICYNLPYPFDNWLFFGIFYGHRGSNVSQLCSQELLNFILDTDEFKMIKSYDDLNQLNYIVGIKKAFLNLDVTFNNMNEGTTVTAVFITPDKYIFINCGDSRSILISSSIVKFETIDHKPTNKNEKERIIKAGGNIVINRLNGQMSVSRALGDFDYKMHSGLSTIDQLISSEPDVFIMDRDFLNDQLIILACDGVWNVFQNEELMNFVFQRCKCTDDLAKISEELIDAALYRGSKDNLSLIAVALENLPRIDLQIAKLDQILDEKIGTKTMEYLYSEGSDSSLNGLIEYLKEKNFENLPPGGIITKQAIFNNLFEKYVSVKSHISDEFNSCEKFV